MVTKQQLKAELKHLKAIKKLRRSPSSSKSWTDSDESRIRKLKREVLLIK